MDWSTLTILLWRNTYDGTLGWSPMIVFWAFLPTLMTQWLEWEYNRRAGPTSEHSPYQQFWSMKAQGKIPYYGMILEILWLRCIKIASHGVRECLEMGSASNSCSVSKHHIQLLLLQNATSVVFFLPSFCWRCQTLDTFVCKVDEQQCQIQSVVKHISMKDSTSIHTWFYRIRIMCLNQGQQHDAVVTGPCCQPATTCIV